MSIKLLLLLLVIFVCPGNSGYGQTSALDHTVSELYQSLTFNESNPPDYEKFRSLFTREAFLISVKDTAFYSFSIDEFIQTMKRQRQQGTLKAFKEYEISRETNRYGNIAHLFSTYETNIRTARGSLKTRGINSIQLLKNHGKWKITGLIWYEEDDRYPLPEKYLNSKK